MPGRKRDSSKPSRRRFNRTKHYAPTTVAASVSAPSPATTTAIPTSRRDSPPGKSFSPLKLWLTGAAGQKFRAVVSLSNDRGPSSSY